MKYRCETTSVEGFIQMLACNYLPHGYYFCAQGRIPDGKDPRAVDEKLIQRYQIDRSRAARSRRKKLGYANVHYLRFERLFVLLATKGEHWFFEAEKVRIQDLRRKPLQVAGFSISFRGGHSHVRLAANVYSELRAEADVAETPADLEPKLAPLAACGYAPVRRQLSAIIRRAERSSLSRGTSTPASRMVLPRRRIVSPFGRPTNPGT
jgi:hypothetical protein